MTKKNKEFGYVSVEDLKSILNQDNFNSKDGDDLLNSLKPELQNGKVKTLTFELEPAEQTKLDKELKKMKKLEEFENKADSIYKVIFAIKNHLKANNKELANYDGFDDYEYGYDDLLKSENDAYENILKMLKRIEEKK